MIVGSVNARLEGVLELQIEHSSGHLHLFDFIIDTGFNGHLTLRAAQISALGLPWRGFVVSTLADGTVLRNEIYDAILMWDENPLQVNIQTVESDPLLGTGVLAGYEMKFPFLAGATVTIEHIP